MYDDTDFSDFSYQLQDLSNGFWTESIDFSTMADAAWVDGNTGLYQDFQSLSENAETYSQLMEDASWDAYYGPVNSEGYTAFDAAQGYTSTDTSFIEPASSAGSMSMISDNSGASTL